MNEVESVIELPWIYDGWSVRIDNTGTMHNRWDQVEYPGRWTETQQWIDAWVAAKLAKENRGE